MSRPKLLPWQPGGIEFLGERKRAMLADDPGLGKTRQLLEAAVGKTLVVAPAYGKSVWIDEHAKWTPDLDMTFVPYSSLVQRAPNEKGHRVLATPHARPAFRTQWDTLIFDEAQYLKGRKTNWTLAALKLKADRVWQATGTPINNWPQDLWVNLRLLRPDDAFLRSFWRWAEHWFDVFDKQFGGKEVLGLKGCTDACAEQELCPHWVRFFRKNLAGHYLRRAEEEVWKDRPPLTQQTLRPVFSSTERKEYGALARDYKARFDGQDVVAWNDADLAQKLRIATTKPKLRVVADLLRDRRPPLVLFCWFQDTAEDLRELVQNAGLSVAVRSGRVSPKAREGALMTFQNGEADVLIATMATSSEMISMARSSTAILVEHSWRPSTNRQAIKRLHRMGQTRPVSVLHLVTPDSVDENMLRTVMQKKDQQIKLMKAGEFVTKL